MISPCDPPADPFRVYPLLNSGAQRLYRALGVLGVVWVSTDHAAAAMGVPWGDAAGLLQRLADEGLLEPERDPAAVRVARYRIPPRVRGHARALAQATEDSRREGARAVEDGARWLLGCADAARNILSPHQGALARSLPDPLPVALPFDRAEPWDREAARWLEEQAENVLPHLDTLDQRGLYELCWRTADALWPVFQRALVPAQVSQQAHLIALGAARQCNHRDAVRQLLLSGAIVHAAAGEVDSAYGWYTSALLEARGGEGAAVLGERAWRDEAQALLGLAGLRFAEGRADLAQGLAESALDLWSAVEERRGCGLARILLGQCAASRGEQQEALGLFTAAGKDLEAEGDRYHAARARRAAAAGSGTPPSTA
ncbi:tetratricopeptide repeat protein [Streptomyces tsukubensis]|uniref:tetratricopeptide repeat protein n=1 Tax=Streptomyces tsukubensis TaxID=83656 RepID=UPI0034506932